MPERLDIIGLISVMSIGAYALITKLMDKWFGRKYENIEALENLLIKTNNGKDILEHLEETKMRKMTSQKESEDMRVIICAFPDLVRKIEALTKSVDHLDKNFRNVNGDGAMNKMVEAFNHMADKFEKHGK